MHSFNRRMVYTLFIDDIQIYAVSATLKDSNIYWGGAVRTIFLSTFDR